MIEFTKEFHDSRTSFKRGEKYCDKCRVKTTHERYRRAAPNGVISCIYRCEDCNRLTTEFKKGE